jgi:hypothetical protein
LSNEIRIRTGFPGASVRCPVPRASLPACA